MKNQEPLYVMTTGGVAIPIKADRNSALIIMLVLGFCAALSIAAVMNVSRYECKDYLITSTSSDYYIPTNGSTITLQLEPDISGTSSGTQVTLSGCTAQDADECKERKWDSTGDGNRDTSVLDGVTEGKRGIRIEDVAGFVLADATAYSNQARLVACGSN